MDAIMPKTTINITVAHDQTRSLVLTFAPSTTVPGGVERVAALQTVTSEVFIDFSQDLPLYWLATVKKNGEAAANRSANPYSGHGDHAPLRLSPDFSIVWNQNAWRIPVFEPSELTVTMGFGLGLGKNGLVSWAYSVPCRPNSSLALDAGKYQIRQSNGAEQPGDPVDKQQPYWDLAPGGQHLLAFDTRGVGNLSTK